VPSALRRKAVDGVRPVGPIGDSCRSGPELPPCPPYHSPPPFAAMAPAILGLIGSQMADPDPYFRIVPDADPILPEKKSSTLIATPTLTTGMLYGVERAD